MIDKLKMVTQPEIRQLLDDILNRLPLTDRVFHELKRTVPLIEKVVGSVSERASKGRVLVVCSNTLLAKALAELGFDVVLWQVPEGDLTADVRAMVRLTAPLDEMLNSEDGGDKFDFIILPYVLEAARENPASVLAKLHSKLNPEGRLLVASASAGRLKYRLRALTGRSQLLDPDDEAPSVSLSWPSLPVRRILDQSQLQRWAARGGFQVEHAALIMDQESTLPIDGMRLQDWLIAHTAYLVRRTLPGFQDCLLATLRPLPVNAKPLVNAEQPRARPLVSVVLFASDVGKTTNLLENLERQTYPADRLEVIVLHPKDQDFNGVKGGHKYEVRLVPLASSRGPSAANAGLWRANGELIALTDDLCFVPPAWIESGVMAIGNGIAAARGQVLAEEGAPSPIFSLPGARGTLHAREYDWVLFPASNSFYRKDALLSVRGFDESLQKVEGGVWGWDSEPAYRLAACGFLTAYDNTLFVKRKFPSAPAWSWINEEYQRAKEIPAALRRMPELRKTLLHQRVFVTPRTRSFVLLVTGLILSLSRRRARYGLSSIPWMLAVGKILIFWPPASWPSSFSNFLTLSVRHIAWLVGLVIGSIKSRRLVL